MTPTQQLHRLLIGTTVVCLVISGWAPADRFTWFLEVVPVFIGGAILMALASVWTFSDFICILLTLHAIILMIGGHYTYAEVPLFNWLREVCHFSRNHYDRLGHFFQGITPALMAREVFLRRGIVKRGRWLTFICVCIAMAISAWYELFEWQAAVWSGTKADAFLGTQGDPWDTQEDMATAFVGALFALWALAGPHERSMQKHVATTSGIAYKENQV